MIYTTRFAPSPSGPLHIGHAYSALTAYRRVAARGGRFLLRIEDIDTARCTAAHERAILDDLAWLGLAWPQPVLRQSTRLPVYRAALDRLIAMGLCYPCRCTRGDIRAALSAPQEGAPIHGPDGLVYPGTCRARPMAEASPTDAIRLNIKAALSRLNRPLGFTETGPVHPGPHVLDPDSMISAVGDIVLARRDIGTSYHLAVVIDDEAQDITEVVRGTDLFEATQIHVLLQALLELRPLTYYHHMLIRDDDGKRLAKRDDARSLQSYRAAGATPADIRALIGLG